MKHPIIIAGPCSAETREQVWSAALQLKDFRLPAAAGGQGISFFAPESGNPGHVPDILKVWENPGYPG